MQVRRSRFAFMLLLGAAALPILPAGVRAQSPVPAETVAPAKLTAYAKAWIEISQEREKTQALLAEPKNKTVEAQTQLKEALLARKAAILAEHELSQDDYDHITKVISTDPAQRKSFDDIVAALAAKSGASQP